MPGIGSIAECPCGFETHVKHGQFLTAGLPLLVVAYSADGCGLISILKSEAEAQSLEFIDEYPDGPGYRCPSCGKLTLSFNDSGYSWD